MRGGVDKGRWMRVYQLVRAEQAAMQRTDYLASICKLICVCVCVCVQADMIFSPFFFCLRPAPKCFLNCVSVCSLDSHGRKKKGQVK